MSGLALRSMSLRGARSRGNTVGGAYSNRWRARRDLNPQPSDPKFPEDAARQLLHRGRLAWHEVAVDPQRDSAVRVAE
jgi:hypothetical protein